MSEISPTDAIACRRPYTVPLPSGRALVLGSRTLVMGVVNVTPDSFSDGGDRFDPDAAIAGALRLVLEGADLIDVGGESTRPGAPAIDAAEEWRRVGPVLEGLRGKISVPVSIDTYKADVASRALALGVDIVNDISALAYEPSLGDVVARAKAAVVLMHNRGRSSDMYALAQYGDVVDDVRRELGERDAAARAAGIAANRIIWDPGVGFAKRAQQSFAVLAGLPRLAAAGRPLLVGPSRKSYLKLALGEVRADARVWGTAASVAASVLLGAHIVRLHDVKEMVDVVRVTEAIRNAV